MATCDGDHCATPPFVLECEVDELGVEQQEKGLHLSPWDRLYEEGMRQEARRMLLQDRASTDRAARSLFDQQCLTADVGGGGGGGGELRYFADRQREWLNKKEERLQRLREAAELAELRRLQPPAINEVSYKMAEKAGHEGPIRGWEAHFARYSLRSAVNPPIPTHTFRPNINLSARSPGKCDKDVGERLYSENANRRQRLGELVRKYRQDELVDVHTGKPFFTPHSMWKTEGIAVSARGRRSAAEVAEILYMSAKEQQERYRVLVERTQEHHTFSPDISSRSRKIAAKRKAAEPKRREVPPQNQTPVERKPKVKLSDFFSRREGCLARRREKLEEVTRQVREREQQECTFNPSISRRSVEIFEGSQHRYSSISPLHDAAQLKKLRCTPHVDVSVVREGVVDTTCDATSPSLYEANWPAPNPASNLMHEYTNNSNNDDDDDGSKLIGEFRHKMKELLDEWRSLECV